MHGCSGGHAWFFRGGMHGFSRGCMAFLGDMHGCSGGACMVAPGGMHGFSRGVCMVFPGGACVVFSMRYGQ